MSEVHGLLLLDKPLGISSFEAVRRVKKIFKTKHVGHGGTLDPLATGALPLALGAATRLISAGLEADKVYEAEAFLGQKTTTGDQEGDVVESTPDWQPRKEDLEEACRIWTKSYAQMPPMYSALKHQGVPLYQWARAGQAIERHPRPVTIHAMTLCAFDFPKARVRVHCSKGTYIRTLIEDWAASMGGCAHLSGLRRLQCAGFEGKMITLDALEQMANPHEALLGADHILTQAPCVSVDEATWRRLHYGQSFACAHQGWVRIAREGCAAIRAFLFIDDKGHASRRIFWPSDVDA